MGFAKLTCFLGESPSDFYFVVSFFMSSGVTPGFCRVVAPPFGFEQRAPIFL